MYSTLLFGTLIVLIVVFVYIFIQYKLNIKNFLPTKASKKSKSKPFRKSKGKTTTTAATRKTTSATRKTIAATKSTTTATI